MPVTEGAAGSGLTCDALDGRHFPPCFKSAAGYVAWRQMALLAKEDAVPCDDCTPLFKQQMLCAGRCQEAGVRARFSVLAGPRRAPPPIQSNGGV